MLEPVSLALQVGFLAVLYLFLLWVATSALRDVAGRRAASSEVDPEATRFPTLLWWRVDWRNDAAEGVPGEWTAYEIEPLALPGVDQPGPR